jgi:ABC-type dipeptide/oligopeptide/nickel transport system ATPase subunit
MLEAKDLSAGYRGKPLFKGLSLCLRRGEMVGLRGPSGSGKTTLGRILAGLHPPASGAVRLNGKPLPSRGAAPVQYLAQTPLAGMNPRWRIGRVLAEGQPPEPRHLADFGIAPDWLDRFTHELSGGQLQRISLLRALSVGPEFLIADEITASLDLISQAAIWQRLVALSAQSGLGLLVISHDDALLRALGVSQIIELAAQGAP